MNDKGRNILWVIAGGYLAYTGGTLIVSVWQSKPNNMWIMLAFGVFFIVVGGAFLVAAAKRIYKGYKEAPLEEDEMEAGAKEAEDALKKLVNNEAETDAAEGEENTGTDASNIAAETAEATDAVGKIAEEIKTEG